MLIVNLVMSFADLAALFHRTAPSIIVTIIVMLIRFVSVALPFWLCRWLFIVGGASTRCGTAARAGYAPAGGFFRRSSSLFSARLGSGRIRMNPAWVRCLCGLLHSPPSTGSSGSPSSSSSSAPRCSSARAANAAVFAAASHRAHPSHLQADLSSRLWRSQLVPPCDE